MTGAVPHVSESARVAVNLTWCRPGRVGGSEQYLCRQLAGLPALPYEVEVFAPRGFRAAHPEIVRRHRVIEMSHGADSRLRRIVAESTWLYRRTRGASLVHHGGGTVPPRNRTPIVLTVHDLQYLEFPEYFGRRRLEYLRQVMPRSVRAASLVAVPTQFVRASVIEAFAKNADDIVVVPHGIEPDFGTHATDERELRSRYNLGDAPIVVYPAMTHPHKGHLFLLAVQEQFWAARGIRLVLIGGEGSAEGSLQSRLSASRVADTVHRLGRVSEPDRNGLIKAASALVFPSQYEGFGAPVIEAMALGTPVIVSDRACLAEVAGEAGLVVPLDVDAWGTSLDLVDARRQELCARGLERSRSFTSAISGAALANAYLRVLGTREEVMR